MVSTDEVFNILGSSGAVVLSASLLPQIYRSHRTKSTKDISYAWQVVYILGLTPILCYYIYYSVWVLFYPTLLELFLIVYLTVLKVYFESVCSPPVAIRDASQSGRSNQGSSIPEDQSHPLLDGNRKRSVADRSTGKRYGLESNYGSSGSVGAGGDLA